MTPLDIDLLHEEPLSEVEIHVAHINFDFHHCKFNKLNLIVNRYFKEGKLELARELERLYLKHDYKVEFLKYHTESGEVLYNVRISVPKEEQQ